MIHFPVLPDEILKEPCKAVPRLNGLEETDITEI